jgi:hypothetical protein
MSESAHVESLDALKEFKAALVTFGVDAQEALAAAESQIQRVLDGLEQQRKRWLAEVRQRQEELTRAKAALVQKRWGQKDGRGPGITDAELAVRHAEQRLCEAEAKVETVKRWLLHLPREIGEYQGPARRLGGWIDADLKIGVALLDRRLGALEAYLTPASPPPELEGAATPHDPPGGLPRSGTGTPAATSPPPPEGQP